MSRPYTRLRLHLLRPWFVYLHERRVFLVLEGRLFVYIQSYVFHHLDDVILIHLSRLLFVFDVDCLVYRGFSCVG